MLFWCARISTRQDHRTGAECGAGNARGDSTHSDELSDEEEEEEAEEVTARPHAAQGREGGREKGEERGCAAAAGEREEGGREDGRTNVVVVVELTKRGKINRPIITRFATDGRTRTRDADGRDPRRPLQEGQQGDGGVGGWVLRCLEITRQGCLCGTRRYVSKSRPG